MPVPGLPFTTLGTSFRLWLRLALAGRVFLAEMSTWIVSKTPNGQYIMRSLIAILSIASLTALSVQGGPSRNLAPTPPMGWNTWNWFGKRGINEQIVQECMDALVAQGLRDAGYTYVVVDGGWRDNHLGPDGELLPHPVKFPRGMKRLADYAHAQGLKFGLHTVPGTHDCGGDPVGGLGHEEVQVRQFAAWGLDFIKLDKCACKECAGDRGWSEDLLKATYGKWRDLLAACGRDIVLSISAYTNRDWYPNVGQMARTTGDIRHQGRAAFDGVKGSVMAVALENDKAAAFAGNGYWNDPDMLVTGHQELTQEEQRSHFALWCVMSAPLMLGDDPRKLTRAEKDIILNKEAIAIDQDPTEQGKRIKADGDGEIWAKRLGGNRSAVLLLNRNGTAARPVAFAVKDAGLSGKLSAKDVFGQKDLGTLGSIFSLELPPHGCVLLLVSTQRDK